MVYQKGSWGKATGSGTGSWGGRSRGNFGTGAKKFSPKKPVRTFRDLEVYQKTMECSVIIDKDVIPALLKIKFEKAEELSKNALSIPLYISEAHSLRFADKALAIGYIEKALTGCNRMTVYLDHIKGLFGDKLSAVDIIDDLVSRYFFARQKIFHLEMSWKKWSTAPN